VAEGKKHLYCHPLTQPGNGNVFGLFFVNKLMTHKYFSYTLVAVALWVSANPAMAAYEHLAERSAQPASKASALSGKLPSKPTFSKTKRDPKVKLVDINTANKAALKKLPGITDADADKIIANRPYASKAWLVTHKVISEAAYHGLSALIQAGQTRQLPAKAAPVPKG
jgi:DNA uptake protein ComE-like DNA-binding protein